MCLDAHAHGVRSQHPIFNAPNKVALTLEDRATPEEYKSHAKGVALGETMPMWRVQTEGYLEGSGQLVGMVSRDAGFFDSPDTEWIAGGVNSKGPDAVAIGRHGNMLHWGFAASPKYMTPEAKLVLVNSLHYIAKFNGQPPIARKVAGTALRQMVERDILSLSEEGYAKIQARYEGYRKDEMERKAQLQAKLDAGGELSKFEKRSLDSEPIQTPGRLASVARYLTGDQIKALDADPVKVAAYLHANMGYLHPTGWWELSLDTELKTLGVGNNELGMLEQAIATFDANPVCAGLLERYTLESFSTQAEWSQWFQANRGLLFFCETAGYKWLINTLESAPVEASAIQPEKESATQR